MMQSIDIGSDHDFTINRESTIIYQAILKNKIVFANITSIDSWDPYYSIKLETFYQSSDIIDEVRDLYLTEDNNYLFIKYVDSINKTKGFNLKE